MAGNSQLEVTLQRAQERVGRVVGALTERDADHFESEAMGYLSALRDEQLRPDGHIDRLMIDLQRARQAWRKRA